jgi:hypothetical protein
LDIQSAFNSGLQGFLQAQEKTNEAATNIVESTAFSAEDFRLAQQPNTNAIEPKTNTENLPNLTQSVVDLKVAELQAKASAQVIKTADDALGNLLDVTV